MEDKIKADDESPVEIKTGSGAVLASARKQQNRTVEEIAAELNLSVTQIKTIELDQSEGLPEPTYVRGYIRSYAKLLGLEPEQVLESYLNPNWQKTSSLEDLPRGFANAEHGDSGIRFNFGKVLILLIFLAAIAALWMSGILQNLIRSNQPSNVQSVSLNGSNNDLEQDSKSQAVEVQSIQESQLTTAADNALGTAEAEQNRLVLNFAQTSWVDIRDGDDKRLAYKSYAQGEQLSVSSSSNMSVFIGNAEGVSAQFNGDEFDISPYKEGVYAKFNLGDD